MTEALTEALAEAFTEASPAGGAAGEPIAYIARTRGYYQALGYGAPYDWARFDTVPFSLLPRPLARCRVAVVTTAAPRLAGSPPPAVPPHYAAGAKFYRVLAFDSAAPPPLRIDHVAIDFDHTSAADAGSYFPLAALQRAAAAGRIGSVAPRFFCLPTQRSQRRTIDDDVPALLELAREDAVDAAVLVPNCPVCHQSVSLAARALETAGIATVVMGCALDIVERVGVPRFVFSDFPLGNGAGRPHDSGSQDVTLDLALAVLASARAPRTTARSPLAWGRDERWKLDYANAARLTPQQLAERRAAFDADKTVAKAIRSATGGGAR